MLRLCLFLSALFVLANCLAFSGDAEVVVDGGDTRYAVVTVDTATQRMELLYEFDVYELEMYATNSRFQTCSGSDCLTFAMNYPEIDFTYRTGGSSDNVNGVATTRYSYTEDGVSITLHIATASGNVVRAKQDGPGIDRQITFTSYSEGANFQDEPDTCTGVQCSSAVDLILVVDTSGSIDANEYLDEQAYAKSVTERFSISENGVHVGLINFSTFVNVESSLTDSTSDIESAIDAMERQLGRTNIGGGIEAAIADFNDNGRDDIPKVILLLTDGAANEPSDGDVGAQTFARQQANAAKAAGIVVYVVGVGDEIDQDNLNELATDADSVAFVDDFAALEETLDALLTTVCVGGVDASCAALDCSDAQFCGCNSCVCTLSDCPFNGEVNSDCECECSGLFKSDCSGCAVPCENGADQDTTDCSCSCPNNYAGATCEICLDVCTGPNQIDSGDCSGCECTGSYVAPACVVCGITCENGGTVNDECTGCDCPSPYSGNTCGNCATNCNGGNQVSGNCGECENCPTNRMGDTCGECNTDDPAEYCNSRGTIIESSNCNRCECEGDWTGTRCQNCNFDCNNHGNAVNNDLCNSCSCSEPYIGDNCEICDVTDSSFCNGHGLPDGENCNFKCNCDLFYGGDTCNVCMYECLGGEPNAGCTGCIDCGDTNFSGEQCDECDVVNTSSFCSDHGHLSNDDGNCDTCVCDEHYSGLQCEICIFSCNGGDENDSCDGCDSCPGAFSEQNDCMVCDQSPDHSYCNGRGSIPDSEVDNCDVCECNDPDQWAGNRCQNCNFECNGGDVKDCERCENCPGALTEVSNCTVCDPSVPSDFCAGRGYLNTSITACNVCICDEDSNYGGDTCQTCEYVCDNGSTPNSSCDGCDCSDDNAFEGDDCNVCNANSTAEFCNNNGFIPQNDTDCNVCECANLWSGTRCSVCNITCNNGSHNDDCTGCDCTGLFDPEDSCFTCTLECGENSEPNEACTSCVCTERYDGDNCMECAADYVARCGNNATATPATDCKCDCTDLFSGEFCDTCDPTEFCGNGTLDNLPISADSDEINCACECKEFFVGERCNECGLDGLEDACSGIAEPDLETCTCNCPQYYENTEGCENCILEEHQCENGGGNVNRTAGVCACECIPPWTGRDCSQCPADTCEPLGLGYYLNEENCTCHTICEDGYVAGDEECEAGLIEDDLDKQCCVECVRVAPGSPCDDGNLCTVGDVCIGEECFPGDTLECTPSTNPCFENVCVEGECTLRPHDLDNVPCDDGDSCTVNEVCIEGECSGTPLDCDVPDPCYTGECEDGQCVVSMNDLPCDDSNPCTINDMCTLGMCVGESSNCEDDGDPCTEPYCTLAGECDFRPVNDTQLCDDADPCTIDDECFRGICRGTPKCPRDNDPCTDDLCDATTGECIHPFVDTGRTCDDGDSCTTGDICGPGGCTGTPTTCVTDTPCEVGECVDGDCIFTPNPEENVSCDDGNACTEGDVCVGRRCVGTDRDCSADDACFTGFCDATTGECDTVPSVTCEPRDRCETARCVNGQCEYEGEVCDDFNACTTDFCRDGICVFEDFVCPDSGSVCSNDTCVEVDGEPTCQATVILPCPDRSGGCEIGVCDDVAGCVYTDLVCADDGDLCTTESCEDGECTSTDVICTDDDDNACSVPSCLNGGCVNNEKDCGQDDDDDGNPNDEDDDDCLDITCRDGECFVDDIRCVVLPPVIPIIPPAPASAPPPAAIVTLPPPTAPAPPAPVPEEPVRNGSAGGGAARTFPLVNDNTVTTSPISTVVIGGAGAGAVAFFAFFALVAGWNNTKQEPAAPAIASLIDTEMSAAAQENPVFMGAPGANVNVLA